MGGRPRGAISLKAGERHDAVAVHRHHRRRDAACESFNLLGNHEAWEIVGDDEDGALGEPGHEPAARARLRLDEWPVGQAEVLRPRAIVSHAFEDEPMVPRARPRIVEAKSLVEDEGPAGVGGAGQGPIKGVISLEAPRGLHPVQHVLTIRPVRPGADVANATFRVTHGLIVPRETMAPDERSPLLR